MSENIELSEYGVGTVGTAQAEAARETSFSQNPQPPPSYFSDTTSVYSHDSVISDAEYEANMTKTIAGMPEVEEGVAAIGTEVAEGATLGASLGALGGPIGLIGGAAVGGLFSFIGGTVTNLFKQHQFDEQLAFQQAQIDRAYAAAHSIGLASPQQFNSINSFQGGSDYRSFYLSPRGSR